MRMDHALVDIYIYMCLYLYYISGGSTENFDKVAWY